MATAPTLIIRGLRIEVEASGQDIVDEVDIEVAPGEVLGLVGESGSGKTTVGLAVLNHARRGVRIAAGNVRIDDTDISSLSDEDLRRTRGRLVSYVPQDPSTALNPAIRIGKQVLEILDAHDFGGSAAARQARVAEVMAEVALPGTPEFLGRYPHQLSGGQQQRVGLAMAFACRPSVIVLDEPTTGLDVSTQSHVLKTVRDLCRTHGVSALYVTHDLAVVANLADRVAVMYAGRIVELASTSRLFTNPAHPYTRHLTAAAPDMDGASQIVGLTGRAPAPGKRPAGCSFADRCSLATDECRTSFPPIVEAGPGQIVRCYHPNEVPQRLLEAKGLVVGGGVDAGANLLEVRDLCASYTGHQVVHNVSFSVAAGECVAVVGESGSGKTTVSRSIGGLHHEWKGEVMLDGASIARSARDRPTAQRLTIQYVFQNPYSSLHPRRPIGDSVARPLLIAGQSERDARSTVAEMLTRVSLTPAYAARYPDQLSGGERQRVAIARALVARPKVLVCDEVTSALDVLVQASIVELLHELRRDLGLAMVFVTHNLPLVRSIADRIVVMADGKVVETGATLDVIDSPKEQYTKRLLADTPRISAAV